MSYCERPAEQDLLELNQSCYCYPIERQKVDDYIIASSTRSDMASLLAARNHYFAKTAVFLSETDLENIMAQVKAIENAIKTPQFQREILAGKGAQAYGVQRETCGAFMGYDFHMTTDGPRLIEINSNAGGAFIVNALEQSLGLRETETEDAIGQMFVNEWQAAGHSGRPRVIAIVDEKPEQQFHYPDMCLAADLLSRQGFETVIADPNRLEYVDGKLMFGDVRIDLVYNRLTDFTLASDGVKNIALALAADDVVVTPGPRHHALHADKQNLVLLTDEMFLDGLFLASDDLRALEYIPRTLIVTSKNSDALWKARRQYFFKPFAGFGSRGVYKGAKLTKRVWAEIIKGGYIAQAFIAPPMRAVGLDSGQAELKFDVRVYTYGGKKLLLAARVYQGQATNLRTEGGGLAPVLTVSF